jgi:hypothetical protein
MTIARAQMYRQLYQMGGIGTLPMDYGQSLQVNNQGQMPMPNYSSAQNITSNPLLNYGQPQLGASGGTPLTMRSGGISRLGYQEGGMGMMEDQAMMQPEQPQQQMMQPPLQGMEQPQTNIKDPKQALEIIIQMLIAQGIPPEEAKKIALQMVQAVAEGGMGEMEDERVEARFGGRIGYASGGIGSLVNREQYGFGSIFKGVTKAVTGVVKGVTNAVKSVAKSPIGKMALTAAALYYAPYAFGAQSAGLAGYAQAFPSLAPAITGAQNFLYGIPGDMAGNVAGGFLDKINPFSASFNLLDAGSSLAKNVGVGNLISAGTGFVGGMFAGGAPKREDFDSDEEHQQALSKWNSTLSAKLNNPNPQFGAGLYPNNPFYPQVAAANGGRIGYQEGGIGDLIKQTTQQAFFGTPMMAMGGRMKYALGAEVPARENQAGVKELDYRDSGGFVPPIGIKERADDIPAMLSNNEFVFTADAVRNAGGGDENLGAQRMYKLMKNLEHGGRV